MSAAPTQCPMRLDPPIQFDFLHCANDNRVRVATVGNGFFVSVDGDNFSGPHRTKAAALAYGASIANATGART